MHSANGMHPTLFILDILSSGTFSQCHEKQRLPFTFARENLFGVDVSGFARDVNAYYSSLVLHHTATGETMCLSRDTTCNYRYVCMYVCMYICMYVSIYLIVYLSMC